MHYILAFVQKHGFYLARSTLNAFHLIPGLHEQRNRRTVYPVLQRERMLCSRDACYRDKTRMDHRGRFMFSRYGVGLLGERAEKSHGYKNYLTIRVSM